MISETKIDESFPKGNFLLGKIDILMISETKIDESFPKGNFLIEVFSTLYVRSLFQSWGDHVIYKRGYTL